MRVNRRILIGGERKWREGERDRKKERKISRTFRDRKSDYAGEKERTNASGKRVRVVERDKEESKD